MTETAEIDGPTFPDVYNAIGRRVWEIAGPAYSEGAHRDLVFGTSWQNVMEAVHQGFLDVWGCECPPFREDPATHHVDCPVYGTAVNYPPAGGAR